MPSSPGEYQRKHEKPSVNLLELSTMYGGIKTCFFNCLYMCDSINTSVDRGIVASLADMFSQ